MRTTVTLILCAALVACGSAPKKDTFYRLGDSVPQAGNTLGATLVHIPPFHANGLLSERALVYAHAGGTALEQYNYHFWVDSPRVLLQQALIDALSGEAGLRVTREPDYAAAYTVDGRIRRFERAGAEGAASAELALEIELFAGRSTEAVVSRTYTRSIKLERDTPAACAAALASASREVLLEFVTELKAQIPK